MTDRLPRGLAALLLAIFVAGCSPKGGVSTPKKPVTHEYHGVKVSDDYEWLEKADDPAVRKWSAAQNQQARAHLDTIPERAMVKDELERLFEKTSATHSA